MNNRLQYQKTNFKTFCILFISGLCAALGFAPLSFLVLLYLVVGVFIYWVIALIHQPNIKQIKTIFAFALGFTFSLGWFVGGVSWVYITLNQFAGLPLFVALISAFLFCATLAIFNGLAVATIFWLYKKNFLSINHKFSGLVFSLCFANVFTIAEIIRSNIFTGFGWLSFGYAHSINSIISFANFAAIIGERGITWLMIFLLAYLVFAIWEFIYKKTIFGLIISVMSWTIVLIFANINYSFTQKNKQVHNFLLIQGNLPILQKWSEKHFAENLQVYQNLIDSNINTNTQTILLPETALATFTNPTSLEFIKYNLKKYQNVNLIAGGIEEENNRYFNSAIIISKNNSENYNNQFYRKRHLVPFGEYPPPLFRWFAKNLNIPMADIQEGVEDQKYINIGNLKTALTICYENLFPTEYLARTNAAEILVNISNTGWYGQSWATPQHLQISQMRTLEAQKPTIQVADTGISAYINAQGKIIKSIPIRTAGAINAQVYGYSGGTPFTKYGEYPIWILIIISQLLILGLSRRNV